METPTPILQPIQSSRVAPYVGIRPTISDPQMDRAGGRTTYAEVEESEADLERLRTWLSRIKARDWFGAPEATASETAVERCAQILAEFEAEALAAGPRAGGGTCQTQEPAASGRRRKVGSGETCISR